MSTGARKARKRAGLKHPKIGAVKVGTPLQDRAWWNEVLQGAAGTREPLRLRSRSTRKRLAALAARVEKPTRETRKLMKAVR